MKLKCENNEKIEWEVDGASRRSKWRKSTAWKWNEKGERVK